jgi:hypothetical protein
MNKWLEAFLTAIIILGIMSLVIGVGIFMFELLGFLGLIIVMVIISTIIIRFTENG